MINDLENQAEERAKQMGLGGEQVGFQSASGVRAEADLIHFLDLTPAVKVRDPCQSKVFK